MLKQAFGRIGWFILANILCVVPYIIFLLITVIFRQSLLGSIKESIGSDMINTVIFLIFVLIFGFTFYKCYFEKNDDFKDFYHVQYKEGIPRKQIIKNHLLKFGKIDAIWILAIAFLLGVMPGSIFAVVTLLFGPSCFFATIVPVRIVAMLIWAIYVAAAYFVCVIFYYGYMEKKRIQKEIEYANKYGEESHR